MHFTLACLICTAAQHGKESRHRNYLSDIEVFVLLDLIGQKQPHFLPLVMAAVPFCLVGSSQPIRARRLQRSTRKQFGKLVELEERLQRQELIHPKQQPYFDGVYKGWVDRQSPAVLELATESVCL